MLKEMLETAMHPVRLRMIQCLMLQKRMTAKEMAAQLTDIPTASLYRHLKKLVDCGAVAIVEERRVRGAVEKVYELREQPELSQESMDPKEALEIGVQTLLVKLVGDFRHYLSREECDPVKDLLSISTSTLLLSDQELLEFFEDMGKAYNKVIGNTPAPGRKPRQITVISSPVMETEKGQND